MPISCLLDENMDPKVAQILSLRGRSTTHVTDLGLAGASDVEVLKAAASFDVLVTLDLFRQFDEWQAAKRAMLESVRVIRIRFGSAQPDDVLEQMRVLLWRWREIEEALEERPEVRLTTVSGDNVQVRYTTQDDLRTMPGPRPNS